MYLSPSVVQRRNANDNNEALMRSLLMFNSAGLKWTVAALLVAMQLCGGVAGAVTIETVPVGNPGNSNDTRYDATGYGGVSYEYNIGTYEVTAGQYVEFLNAVAKTDTYGLYNANMDIDSFGCQITQVGSAGGYSYDFSGKPAGTTDVGWASRPVNHVSWGDGTRFANWLHNGQPTGAQDLTTTEDGAYYLNGAIDSTALMTITRESDATWFIPTEDEWYKAAYYNTVDAYFDYPTGSDTAPTAEAPPGSDMTNGSANYDGSVDFTYRTTPVGAYLAKPSTSPYGTFDQGGNLWEWNETVDIGSSRGLRGGCWIFSPNNLAASTRSNISPTAAYSDFGFRVASSVAIPEPGSITLLLCGLLASLVCWRRRR